MTVKKMLIEVALPPALSHASRTWCQDLGGASPRATRWILSARRPGTDLFIRVRPRFCSHSAPLYGCEAEDWETTRP